VLVLIPGIGTGRLTHGAQRWIRLGPIQFQPSEITKVGIILYFADSISKKKDKMATLRYGIVPYVAILGVIAALMAKEPHLRTCGRRRRRRSDVGSVGSVVVVVTVTGSGYGYRTVTVTVNGFGFGSGPVRSVVGRRSSS